MSNKECRTAEVFESSKVIFFTSIFCGSLFCGSAVYIFEGVIADSGIFDRFQLLCFFFLTPDTWHLLSHILEPVMDRRSHENQIVGIELALEALSLGGLIHFALAKIDI